jgi:hypothetical protein
MKRLLLATAALPALLPPGNAAACGIHPPPASIIHNSLPTPLPAGAIIAEVEVSPEDAESPVVYWIRARVRRMIQGEAAPILILRDFGRMNTCQSPFGNGRAGLIVAVPDGHSDGIPIVRPLYVLRGSGYRLPDGYQLPPPGIARTGD